jgi:hypothetical protein
MKMIVLGLIALSALCAACHEERQDPTPDYGAVRARAAASGNEVQRQTPPQNGDAR